MTAQLQHLECGTLLKQRCQGMQGGIFHFVCAQVEVRESRIARQCFCQRSSSIRHAVLRNDLQPHHSLQSAKKVRPHHCQQLSADQEGVRHLPQAKLPKGGVGARRPKDLLKEGVPVPAEVERGECRPCWEEVTERVEHGAVQSVLPTHATP